MKIEEAMQKYDLRLQGSITWMTNDEGVWEVWQHKPYQKKVHSLIKTQLLDEALITLCAECAEEA